MTICAERVAVFKAVSEGEEITELAVVTETGNSQPCGACRQIIYEFNKNTKIYYFSGGELVVKTISELLPDAFYLEKK